MNTLLRKLTLFLLPLVLLLGAALAYFEANKQHWLPLFQEQERFLSRTEPVDTLIIGNSRARFSIDTDAFDDAINLATPGESFVETHAHLRFLLSHGKPPARLLFPCGMVTFKGMDFRRAYYWSRYVNFWDAGWRNGQPISYLGEYLQGRLLPYRRPLGKELERRFLRVIGEDRNQRPDRDQQRFSELKEADQNQLIQGHISHLEQHGMLDPAAWFGLKDTIRLLKESGTPAICIKFPLTDRYRTALAGLSARQGDAQARIDKEIAGSGIIRQLNYEALFQGRDDLFRDHHHLNRWGREALMKRLLRDIGRSAGESSL
ncbi:MAG: hypothetical protein ACPG4N_02500 [Gammaproteobacteria bacterium]